MSALVRPPVRMYGYCSRGAQSVIAADFDRVSRKPNLTWIFGSAKSPVFIRVSRFLNRDANCLSNAGSYPSVSTVPWYRRGIPQS